MNRRDWVQGLLGAPVFEQLATGLAGSELQSVLLQVMHSRAGQRGPKDLLAQYQRARYIATGAGAQLIALRFQAPRAEAGAG